jgi:hypothetical protein
MATSDLIQDFGPVVPRGETRDNFAQPIEHPGKLTATGSDREFNFGFTDEAPGLNPTNTAPKNTAATISRRTQMISYRKGLAARHPGYNTAKLTALVRKKFG